MRNNPEPKIKKIIALAEKLPFFTLDTFSSIEKNKNYLKILFSRYAQRGKLIRLKKGLYVAQKYVDQTQKNNTFSSYLEFLAANLYRPSYLSLDWVLYQHHLLTEIPVNFTLVTKNKTANFSNLFGHFFYHKIKEELFCGFEIIKEADFTILRATKAKALFDFLYLRKNLLLNKKTSQELRLNLNHFTQSDLKEFKHYLAQEGSKKMRAISNFLLS